MKLHKLTIIILFSVFAFLFAADAEAGLFRRGCGARGARGFRPLRAVARVVTAPARAVRRGVRSRRAYRANYRNNSCSQMMCR